MEADFTLVPIGGLGNRMNALCSAIAYCCKRNKTLKILWFKDPGLTCSIKELFSIDPRLTNVQMTDAQFSDFLLRAYPRKKNFWIPKIFQYFLFDRRIYVKEFYDVVTARIKPDFGDLDKYKHIFMVSYWKYWKEPDMMNSIVISPSIIQKATEIINSLREYKRIVGIHIRRTDSTDSIRKSPTNLFIHKIQDEIDIYKDKVCFYLASDSLEEKHKMIERFGNKIKTSLKPTSRNNKEGIVDALVEMNVLSYTDKLYGSYSSFSETAHLLSNNEFEELSVDD